MASDLFQKLAGMLGSDHEGERAAAINKCNEWLKANKRTWAEMLGGGGVGQTELERWKERALRAEAHAVGMLAQLETAQRELSMAKAGEAELRSQKAAADQRILDLERMLAVAAPKEGETLSYAATLAKMREEVIAEAAKKAAGVINAFGAQRENPYSDTFQGDRYSFRFTQEGYYGHGNRTQHTWQEDGGFFRFGKTRHTDSEGRVEWVNFAHELAGKIRYRGREHLFKAEDLVVLDSVSVANTRTIDITPALAERIMSMADKLETDGISPGRRPPYPNAKIGEHDPIRFPRWRQAWREYCVKLDARTAGNGPWNMSRGAKKAMHNIMNNTFGVADGAILYDWLMQEGAATNPKAWGDVPSRTPDG